MEIANSDLSLKLATMFKVYNCEFVNGIRDISLSIDANGESWNIYTIRHILFGKIFSIVHGNRNIDLSKSAHELFIEGCLLGKYFLHTQNI